jgi:hypothetical protein
MDIRVVTTAEPSSPAVNEGLCVFRGQRAEHGDSQQDSTGGEPDAPRGNNGKPDRSRFASPRPDPPVTLAQSEFKLKWSYPSTHQSSRGLRGASGHGERLRPQSSGGPGQTRISLLNQPPNRTPRGWKRLEQSDEVESFVTPRSMQGKHRPGWLSARQPLSGPTTPRVQSARARRPPDWSSGAEPAPSTARSVLSSLPQSDKDKVDMASVEQIQQEQERRSQEELKQFREKIFENPKRRYSKREMESFCHKLWGNNDVERMKKICSRLPEDRSYEDCTFLCKMLNKSTFIQKQFEMQNLRPASTCVQYLHVAPGDDLKVHEETPQVFILVQGLMAEPSSGDLVKEGDHILRMPSRKTPQLLRTESNRWTGSFSKIRILTLTKSASSKKLRRQSSKLMSPDLNAENSPATRLPSMDLDSTKVDSDSPPAVFSQARLFCGASFVVSFLFHNGIIMHPRPCNWAGCAFWTSKQETFSLTVWHACA